MIITSLPFNNDDPDMVDECLKSIKIIQNNDHVNKIVYSSNRIDIVACSPDQRNKISAMSATQKQDWTIMAITNEHTNRFYYWTISLPSYIFSGDNVEDARLDIQFHTRMDTTSNTLKIRKSYDSISDGYKLFDKILLYLNSFLPKAITILRGHKRLKIIWSDNVCINSELADITADYINSLLQNYPYLR
jgi:hypothetical protein